MTITLKTIHTIITNNTTYGCRSLTFFCALLGLPSSSELFTLDLVFAAFFSFCLESPAIPKKTTKYATQYRFFETEKVVITKPSSCRVNGAYTHLFSPYLRWNHSLCSQSAFLSGPPQTEPGLCRDVWCVCRPAKKSSFTSFIDYTENRCLQHNVFILKVPTISYVCMASCTLSSPNSLHLL